MISIHLHFEVIPCWYIVDVRGMVDSCVPINMIYLLGCEFGHLNHPSGWWVLCCKYQEQVLIESFP
jgi:hypothetical protein